MGKNAILTVSFGTSHADTREKTIGAIEEEFRRAYPGWEVRRAFTSRMIIRSLAGEGIQVDTVPQALEKLAAQGFTRVACQPTHVMNGEEYDLFCREAAPFQTRFERFGIGTPLLTELEDYHRLIQAISAEVPGLGGEDALVLMGHGSSHFANAAYGTLDYAFKDSGHRNIFVGTVEGYPDLEAIRRRMQEFRPRTVWLMPLMVVAGDHAVNDMAGPEEDSWQSVLTADGWQVRSVLQGLGELPAVRRIYLDHLARVTGRLQ